MFNRFCTVPISIVHSVPNGVPSIFRRDDLAIYRLSSDIHQPLRRARPVILSSACITDWPNSLLSVRGYRRFYRVKTGRPGRDPPVPCRAGQLRSSDGCKHVHVIDFRLRPTLQDSGRAKWRSTGGNCCRLRPLWPSQSWSDQRSLSLELSA
jgi:hypothetical protein